MTTRRRIARYGWVPDLPDHRDKVTEPPNAATLALIAATPVVDLSGSPYMPPIWDQGQLGSCTAHSVGAAYEFAALATGHEIATPSRLYIYYAERVIEGTVSTDSGAQIRDGFKVLDSGVPPETDWPYDITRFALAPPPQAVADAAGHTATLYTSVPQARPDIQAQLVNGRPVSFGFSVYESFETPAVAASGIVPLPAKREALLGGHAVLICGYTDDTQLYRVRNSWGTGWGQLGYFEMPYAYAENQRLASDFWTAEAAT